ncbi:FAD-dependent oxidoreductase [Halobacillus amylolyticus]|uniref:FAD-dependent oxidoreductase n=1 Tax=Halobacillus amylolyticus TaxID=2932259 RepID=A0ABY4HIC4_9BACI|nr:FAD-dependent oxidoreductase [Halobacillus amylolyticus]UOR13650.1 FAD-dependent oxidoreductase [Halobacillus amylolyticus]
MSHIPNTSNSLWRDLQVDTFPALSEDRQADVTVIGAGITGITTAYLLTKQGYNVILLEAGKIMEGTTGYTTAKITSQHGLIYAHLLKTIGEKKSKLYYQANQEALTLIDEIRTDNGIDCDFSYQDAYVYGETSQSKREIEEEAKAYERLGIDGGLIKETPLPFPVASAVKINDQAQFHPYLRFLVHDLIKRNTPIFENTRAVDVEKDRQPKVTTQEGYSVTSDHVVMATHFPFKDLENLYFARLHVERSYSIAVEPAKKIPEEMYLSADQPKRSLRYTVNDLGEPLLLVGGNGHTSGQVEDTLVHYRNLRSFAHHHFTVEEISYRWSAQDLSTMDMVPYIGPITEKQSNIYVATGFAKWGMTNGTIAARLISDLINQKDNPYTDLFSPSRFHLKQDMKNLTKENADVAKEFVKGKLNRQNKKLEELDHDEGAVVHHNGKRAGAYKDSAGNLSLVDTACTHMGCELSWNTAERSWDCPCHGSRFTTGGKVIEGPATKPLKKLSE